MKLVIVAVLVTLISLLGSRLSFQSIRFPLGIRNIFLTGGEFVLVGLLLGGSALDILDRETLQGMGPFLCLGLSWIGLLFGIQWEWRRVTRIPVQVFGVATCQSLVTAAVVGVCIYLAARYTVGAVGAAAWVPVVAVAAAASDTAQSSLALATRGARHAARPVVRLLQNISNIDAVYGVLAFGLVCCFAVPHASLPGIAWVGITVLLGLVVGLLTVSLTARRLRDDQTRLVVLGIVAFSGGISLTLGLSPLLVNLIAGAIIANLARHRALAAIRNELLRGERAVYIVFLLLLGAGWKLGSPYMAVLAPVYLASRAAGKILGGLVASRALLPQSLPRLGLGLLPQGGMALAIVANLQLVSPSALSDAAISVVIIGMFLFESISPSFVRRVLPGSP